jgi:hypothetical protein
MPGTFVPDEPLTPTHPLRVDPASRHAEAVVNRSECPRISQFRYDLFRSRDEPELYCAVPEDRPAPAFLASEPWQAAGQMAEADSMPLGLRPRGGKDRGVPQRLLSVRGVQPSSGTKIEWGIARLCRLFEVWAQSAQMACKPS